MTKLQVNPPRKAGRAEKGPAVLPTRRTPGGASPPHGQPRRTDVRGRFSVTDLIVVRRQLVQKLLYARLFSRAVDVGDLVLGQAAVVLVHLRSKRGDCSGGPRPNPCPAKQPPPEPAPAGSSRGFRAGKRSRALLLVLLPFLRGERGDGSPGEVAELVTVCSVSLHSVSMFRRLRGCVGTCLGRGG